jgi:hypothetical protein
MMDDNTSNNNNNDTELPKCKECGEPITTVLEIAYNVIFRYEYDNGKYIKSDWEADETALLCGNCKEYLDKECEEFFWNH